jgi:hypothetical protein
MSKGGSIKAQIAEVQAKQEEEDKLWNQMGINLNGLQIPPSEVFKAQCHIQATTNVLIEKGLATEDELTLEMKKLVLKNMQQIRQNTVSRAKEAQSAAIREQLTKGVVPPQLPDGVIKLPWQKGNGHD